MNTTINTDTKRTEDAMQKQSTLQDIFLNQARRDKIPVTVYLTNGFQIKGIVRGFDTFTVVLDSDGRQQLIYKHALSTIVPARPVQFAAAQDREEEPWAPAPQK